MVLPVQKDYRETNELIKVVRRSQKLTSVLKEGGKCQRPIEDEVGVQVLGQLKSEDIFYSLTFKKCRTEIPLIRYHLIKKP